MTNDTYTEEQVDVLARLVNVANRLLFCGEPSYSTRCVHARDVENAARAFLVSLADAQAIEDTKPITKCPKCERAEIHAVGLEGTLRRRNATIEELRESLAKRDERIAELEATSEPKPVHPWDEADLQPGDVAVFKLDGEKTISAVQDWANERRRWAANADRITDWQVFRPTWAKDGEEA